MFSSILSYDECQFYKILGKIVLSVGAALCKSFFCPWLVLGLSFLSFCCLYNVFVMPLSSSLNIFLMLSLPRPFIQAEGFSRDIQRKSERPNTFLNMSFSLIANRQTFESQYPVFLKTIFLQFIRAQKGH